MSELEEAIKQLGGMMNHPHTPWMDGEKGAVALVLSELERAQAAVYEIAVAEVEAVAKLGLAEQRIAELECENEQLSGMYESALTDYNNLLPLTDPCPDDCAGCGGVGRVAKAQPETERSTEYANFLVFANAVIWLGGDPEDDDNGDIFETRAEAAKAVEDIDDPVLRVVTASRAVGSWEIGQ